MQFANSNRRCSVLFLYSCFIFNSCRVSRKRPFAAGRYSFITNWTAFTQHLEAAFSCCLVLPFGVAQVEGLKVECHLVHGNFLRQNPTNVAVVFHASRDALALSHNDRASGWDDVSRFVTFARASGSSGSSGLRLSH